MKIMIAAGLLALSTMSGAPPAPAPKFTVRENIVYGSYSGLALLMDMRTPGRANGYGIVHIPGSGFQAPLSMAPWQLKNPVSAAEAEDAMLAAGFTIFTINHRAAPRFKHPSALLDAQRAVRFVRANAKSLGVSPDWLGLMGESSGAGLGALLATLGEGTDAGVAPGPSPQKAQCAVLAMGPYDMLALGRDGWAVSLVANYLDVTAPFDEEKGLAGYEERLAPHREASALTYVGGTMPEMFLLHGDKDKLVPLEQSRSLAAAVRAKGGIAVLEEMPGIGHNVPALYRAKGAAWMRDCLNRTRSPRR